jgi:hypothetical protein
MSGDAHRRSPSPNAAGRSSSVGRRVNGFRVVNEIHCFGQAEDGLWHALEVQELRSRFGPQTPVSVSAEAGARRLLGPAMDGDPDIVVHSTSWYRHPDGSLRLSWVVYSPALPPPSGTPVGYLRLNHGRPLVEGVGRGRSSHAHITQAAGHLSYLLGKELADGGGLGHWRPSSRSIVGAGPNAGAAAQTLLAIDPAPAGEFTLIGPTAAMRGTPRTGPWQVGIQAFVTELQPHCALAKVLVDDVTEDEAIRKGVRSIGDRVQERVRRTFPHLGACTDAVVVSTSWSFESGVLLLRYSVIPRELRLVSAAVDVAVGLPNLGIDVGVNKRRPDARSASDLACPLHGPFSHSLENVSDRARLGDPDIADRLAAVPGRSELIASISMRRDVAESSDPGAVDSSAHLESA